MQHHDWNFHNKLWCLIILSRFNIVKNRPAPFGTELHDIHEFHEWHMHTGICNNGDIRLVNGGNRYEGRVEVCLSNQWGTVCDDYWKSNPNNARVACRQLGYSDIGECLLSTKIKQFRPGKLVSHQPFPGFWCRRAVIIKFHYSMRYWS